LQVDQAWRLKGLEQENVKLKRLVSGAQNSNHRTADSERQVWDSKDAVKFRVKHEGVVLANSASSNPLLQTHQPRQLDYRPY
jgi:hypothetical protein